MFQVLTLLWPVLWYLWVHCLNANSNFYFAITLAFVLFQSFLLSGEGYFLSILSPLIMLFLIAYQYDGTSSVQ